MVIFNSYVSLPEGNEAELSWDSSLDSWDPSRMGSNQPGIRKKRVSPAVKNWVQQIGWENDHLNLAGGLKILKFDEFVVDPQCFVVSVFLGIL